ncbi:MAG: 2Fe-2S iron-sulfur cluster-binding protein, partial [Planctomycetota bacterium]
MPVVTLSINGQPVSASADETLLTVAKEAGVKIPTLCHLNGVSDVAACRLCLVEVEGSPKLQAACVTKAAEGMRIQTHTPKLHEYRKMIVEL